MYTRVVPLSAHRRFAPVQSDHRCSRRISMVWLAGPVPSIAGGAEGKGRDTREPTREGTKRSLFDRGVSGPIFHPGRARYRWGLQPKRHNMSRVRACLGVRRSPSTSPQEMARVMYNHIYGKNNPSTNSETNEFNPLLCMCHHSTSFELCNECPPPLPTISQDLVTFLSGLPDHRLS